jgi:hypothetical protein
MVFFLIYKNEFFDTNHKYSYLLKTIGTGLSVYGTLYGLLHFNIIKSEHIVKSLKQLLPFIFFIDLIAMFVLHRINKTPAQRFNLESYYNKKFMEDQIKKGQYKAPSNIIPKDTSKEETTDDNQSSILIPKYEKEVLSDDIEIPVYKSISAPPSV